MQANDMKAIIYINSKSFLLWTYSGHQGCFTKLLSIQAKCVLEMKKDQIYKLCLDLNITSFDIVSASYACLAGRGPCAYSCSLYAYKKFS